VERQECLSYKKKKAQDPIDSYMAQQTKGAQARMPRKVSPVILGHCRQWHAETAVHAGPSTGFPCAGGSGLQTLNLAQIQIRPMTKKIHKFYLRVARRPAMLL
jgi:hypothetical protein